MEYRYIKNTKVSLLGMGCMRLPVLPDSEEIDVPLVEKMVEEAYKSGITYFDTAYPYHNGKSEEVIGQVLKKYPRDHFYLADKLPIWKCHSLDDVRNLFEEQLKKCQVEYFDFYLCHAMNMERFEMYQKYQVFPYLKQLKKEGKIRHLGFSFHDAPQKIEIIADALDWDFAQIQFNYLDYEMQDARKQYEILTSKNISVIVMEPVRGGMLANVCPQAEEIFRNARPQASNASWALRYVAQFENVKVILSGMSNLEQMKDNLHTFSTYEVLSCEENQVIQQAKKAILGDDFIPCTGCRYCMPCPFGVNIPQIFKSYNLYGIHKNKEKFCQDMQNLEEEHQPDRCRACGKCMKSCPQRIKIPDQMKKIGEIL